MLFIGCWFSAVSDPLFCEFVAPCCWEVACDAVDSCCGEVVGLKLLEEVGVTGLVGWLVDEGSELPSLVRFFFKKPRAGIKSVCKSKTRRRGKSLETGQQRPWRKRRSALATLACGREQRQ